MFELSFLYENRITQNPMSQKMSVGMQTTLDIRVKRLLNLFPLLNLVVFVGTQCPSRMCCIYILYVIFSEIFNNSVTKCFKLFFKTENLRN